MKKNFITAFLVIIIALAIVWLLKRTANQWTAKTSYISQIVAISSNLPSSTQALSLIRPVNSNSLQLENEIENRQLNAIAATNIEQWTKSIKELKPLEGFKFQQHWLAEKPGRTNGIPIVLSIGNETVKYNAVLVSVNARNEDGSVRRVEMQTFNMNVDETRQFGLQLCNMLGVDSKGFTDWCDKVGNHWLDAPLYATGNGSYGFGVHRTFNDEKPWYINFVIDYQH